MDELKKIAARARSGSTRRRRTRCCWCSTPATGQNALTQAQQFNQAVGVTGTRPDQARRHRQGRHRVRHRRRLGIPIRFVGVGETAEDFGVFDAESSSRPCWLRRRASGDEPHDPLRPRLQALPERARGAVRPQLEIERGEMAFLTGHSGAGKSTLLRLIALIERPTRGTLVVNGQNIATVPRREDPRLPAPARRRVPGPQAAPGPHRLRQRRAAARDRRRAAREIGKRVRAALDQVGTARPRTQPPARAVRRASSSASASRAPSSAKPRGAHRRRADRQPRPGPVARES